MAKRDYYEVLGLAKNATSDEIKSAYRKLAKKYHPDQNKADDAEVKFKEVQEAYDVLYDEKKRATYDQFGHAAFDQTGGHNPFQGGFGGFDGMDIDLGDIFSSFFGGGQRGGRQRHTGPVRGNDSLTRIRINFMDAIRGKKIELNHTYDKVCTTCAGSGAQSKDDVSVCDKCRGSGVENFQQQTLFGTVQSQRTCSKCSGSGKIIKNKCQTCSGNGYNRVKENLEINIPAGIGEGQRIRVQGKGERGYNGGPNGDLYLEIAIKAHKDFVRRNNDIYLKVPISFVDATLGIDVDIPTVYGTVEVKVPSGTQPGTVLRLAGKGVKGIRGNVGDQYLEVEVQTPTNLNAEQKELLEQYKKIEPKKESIFEKFKKRFKR